MGAQRTLPGLAAALRDVDRPLRVVQTKQGLRFANPRDVDMDVDSQPRAFVPALAPDQLGDPEGRTGKWNYVAGAMAGGIASVELVEAMARSQLLAVYGAAGLSLRDVSAGVERLATRLFDLPWAANLIHSPYEPKLESEVADLYIRRGVRRISASAYLDLTLPLVRYRTHGLREVDGRVIPKHHVIAKVSRVEVATKFLSPPPPAMLAKLVAAGDLTAQEAELAQRIPMADDLTVEADSGGHTDNRPALTLLPTMLSLRDRLQRDHGWTTPCRVGAAGGIGTPHAVAAAFAMGAAYVVTGSVNQACREAGTSDAVLAMLAETGQADVTMAPAADMFEMGVQLQVLRRGTMFPMRARKLYELYRAHESLDALPEADRSALERQIFRAPLSEVWAQTRAYWEARDNAQVARADADPRHRMALTFRWYLGQASRWANAGLADRKIDYQVWCGPAMGAFNEWARGSFLEDWHERRVVTVAENLMHGACVVTRAAALRNQGIAVPNASVDVTPREDVAR